MNSRSDLIAEAIAGACAAVVAAVVLDRIDIAHRAADKVPRLGWKKNHPEQPPILARILSTVLASIVFRSTFSLTRTLAGKVV